MYREEARVAGGSHVTGCMGAVDAGGLGRGRPIARGNELDFSPAAVGSHRRGLSERVTTSGSLSRADVALCWQKPLL